MCLPKQSTTCAQRLGKDVINCVVSTGLLSRNFHSVHTWYFQCGQQYFSPTTVSGFWNPEFCSRACSPQSIVSIECDCTYVSDEQSPRLYSWRHHARSVVRTTHVFILQQVQLYYKYSSSQLFHRFSSPSRCCVQPLLKCLWHPCLVRQWCVTGIDIHFTYYRLFISQTGCRITSQNHSNFSSSFRD